MRKIKTAIGIVIAAVAVTALSGGIVVTKENEFKLIRQFGRVERVIDSPGITYKIPFIQTADTLPKQILIYDLAASDVITMDKKTMLSDSYVLWRIEDPLKFAQSLNSSLSGAESRIDTVVYNSVKNVISSMTLSIVPVTGTLMLLCTSNTFTMPKPICMSITCPAVCTREKNNVVTYPITSPNSSSLIHSTANSSTPL